ncbi:MAG: hypothetical protein NT045_08395 [Candidatus Aureabacteria bacterium]|nr:hypothetical protein [Candidatus Auribacterota bacterium]
MKDKNLFKRLLLGLGFDGKDGIWRVTRGENYQLLGGSEDTHGEMQEKAAKMNEHLKKRKKSLDEVTVDEFIEIAEKVEMFKTRKAKPGT